MRYQALRIGVTVLLGLASQGMAAPGAVVASGLSSTSPGGFINDGTNWWVTDHQNGLCRLDPAPAPNPASPFVMTNCL